MKNADISGLGQAPTVNFDRGMVHRYRRGAPVFLRYRACRAAFLNFREQVLSVIQPGGQFQSRIDFVLQLEPVWSCYLRLVELFDDAKELAIGPTFSAGSGGISISLVGLVVKE